ncbi:MAG TPA: Ppx/GppA phosphatase family protein [Anaerolineales bacterium]|nr:Ppx/GppA phosphatase family protein [Anaerolineales bacterium]
MQNIAAIDVGSNAIRMAVGRVNDKEQVEVLDNIRLPVRLGGDAFTHGKISESNIQAATDAFLRFRKVADDFAVTHMRAVATSAMREASNSRAVINRIRQRTKINLEVIGGEEEARLIHLGVSKAIDLKGKRAVLVDIGGGSVEVTTSEGAKLISTESYNMGTVRLLSRFGEVDAKNGSMEQLVREYAKAARKRIDREIGKNSVDLCIGTGGNAEEMGVLRTKLFKHNNDQLVTLSELNELVEKLSKLTIEERIKKLDLRPDRADVILPACVVMQTIARIVRVKTVHVPGIGLKDGILWEIAPQVLHPRLPRREQVWASAMRLGQKYQFDAEHGTLIADLAKQLFDQTTDLHKLGSEDRLMLEIAALLHDIGHFINTIDHNKHGYYILTHNFLMGLTERQQAIVANIVYYHRKDDPSSDDGNFKQMSQKDRQIMIKLAALLRLADAMDASHTGRIRSAKLEKRKGKWILIPRAKGDLILEKWTLTKRRALFQNIFDVELEIE